MNRPLHLVLLMAAVMLVVLAAGFYYLGKKSLKWLKLVLPRVNPKVFIAIPAVTATLLVLGFSPLDIDVKKHIVRINWTLMGIFAYLLMYFLIAEGVLFACRLAKRIPKGFSRTVTVVAGWIVVAATAVTCLYGGYNGARVTAVSYEVEIGVGAENLHIALISDIHLGYHNDAARLAKIVEAVNALRPDIVVIAGDIFNDDFRDLPDPDAAAAVLRRMESRYGAYACLGNHDSGSTYPQMVRFLEESGVRVLQDEYEVIDSRFAVVGRAESSPIVGLEERRKPIAEVVVGIPEGLPVIVIDHNPNNVGEYGEYGKYADLILAGHTHRGQMFPGNVVTHMMFRENYGYYHANANRPHVIVTSGAAVWGPPFRVGSNNEVASIIVR